LNLAAGTLSSGGSFAISSGSSNKWGWSFEIASDDGNHFFYTHVKDPLAPDTKPGARVKKGQLLGWVDQAPHAPNHLHFAHKEGNPCAYLKNCRGKDGQAPNDFGRCFE
jgi:murein DD-endopeptidase MepM/ murein hydrolase activator NlpD